MLTGSLVNVHDCCFMLWKTKAPNNKKLIVIYRALFPLCGNTGSALAASRVAHTWEFQSEREHVARGHKGGGSIYGLYFFGVCGSAGKVCVRVWGGVNSLTTCEPECSTFYCLSAPLLMCEEITLFPALTWLGAHCSQYIFLWVDLFIFFIILLTYVWAWKDNLS